MALCFWRKRFYLVILLKKSIKTVRPPWVPGCGQFFLPQGHDLMISTHMDVVILKMYIFAYQVLSNNNNISSIQRWKRHFLSRTIQMAHEQLYTIMNNPQKLWLLYLKKCRRTHADKFVSFDSHRIRLTDAQGDSYQGL